MGKSLAYIPPSSKDGKIIVNIEKEDLLEQQKYWENLQIGYVIGDSPYVKTLESFEDRDCVLQSGPYMLFNKPLILHKWDIDFEFDPNCLTLIPLWVTLPGLLMGYWSGEALSKMASAIGKPLYTDNFTASMERISYAKILVETNVFQPLINSIEIITPSGILRQPVEYEWRPSSAPIV
ncbi:hypothetical protein R3W88_033378 [Solanum pinnatisectum]|uniref:DUF4283 domain-containing protein n=1 Tax=Solanum pinnatisectum TaxID=50273 RepID=A0AAV9K1D6_9SOLN|nr:hypothetical protein R3W88_033378 [Solanum pinnatisectum]